MNGPTSKPVVPDDEAAARAWTRIMRDAEAYGLVIQAYGGVAMLAMPEEQRKAGIRDRVLDAINMTECGR